MSQQFILKKQINLPNTLRLNPLPGRALRPLPEEASPLDATAPLVTFGAGKATALDELPFVAALALLDGAVFVVFAVIGISNIFSTH